MRALIPILCAGLLLAGCKKNGDNPPYRHQGTILGYDARLCAMPPCGGLEIIIKNDTAKNPPAFYQINSTLAKLGITLSADQVPDHISLPSKADIAVEQHELQRELETTAAMIPFLLSGALVAA